MTSPAESFTNSPRGTKISAFRFPKILFSSNRSPPLALKSLTLLTNFSTAFCASGPIPPAISAAWAPSSSNSWVVMSPLAVRTAPSRSLPNAWPLAKLSARARPRVVAACSAPGFSPAAAGVIAPSSPRTNLSCPTVLYEPSACFSTTSSSTSCEPSARGPPISFKLSTFTVIFSTPFSLLNSTFRMI